jgi:hypothetical protein
VLLGAEHVNVVFNLYTPSADCWGEIVRPVDGAVDALAESVHSASVSRIVELTECSQTSHRNMHK